MNVKIILPGDESKTRTISDSSPIFRFYIARSANRQSPKSACIYINTRSKTKISLAYEIRNVVKREREKNRKKPPYTYPIEGKARRRSGEEENAKDNMNRSFFSFIEGNQGRTITTATPWREKKISMAKGIKIIGECNHLSKVYYMMVHVSIIDWKFW